MNKIVFFLFVTLATSVFAQDCSNISTCKECVSADTKGACGWCAISANCMAGNSSGPTGGNSCSKNHWVYGGESKELSRINSFPVNPKHFDVYLYPNSELSLEVAVTNPLADAVPIDLYFVQDLSGSFSDDIQTFRGLCSDLTTEVLKYQSDTRFGLTSFAEKPIFPFGFVQINEGTATERSWPKGSCAECQGLIDNAMSECPERTDDSGPPNWAFCNEMSLTFDYMEVQKTVNRLTVYTNSDWNENSIESLMFLASCYDTIQWREEARKVALVATDAGFHEPCDTSKDAYGSLYCPFKGPADYTCTQPGFKDDIPYTGARDDKTGVVKPETLKKVSWDYNVPGIKLDFPDPHEVGKMLAEKNIVPVIAASQAPPEHNDIPSWQVLSNEWGFGKVLELNQDSSNLVEIIKEALSDLTTVMMMKNTQDDNGQLKKINPPEFTGVVPGDHRFFQIVLLDDKGAVEEDTLTFSVVGFGTVTINVTNQIPCIGCDGSEDTSKVVDLCGICEGTGECVGCDGIAYSGATKDLCGICNGDGLSCLDCFDEVNGTAVIDACGLCNGTNDTCVGCDGVIASGLVYDFCGVCNGTNDCRGCDGIINSTKLFDNCGVCGGNNLSCVLKAAPPPDETGTIVAAATAAIVVGVIAAVALVLIILFFGKKKFDQYQYMNNQSMNAVVDNPTYEGNGGWHDNAIAK